MEISDSLMGVRWLSHLLSPVKAVNSALSACDDIAVIIKDFWLVPIFVTICIDFIIFRIIDVEFNHFEFESIYMVLSVLIPIIETLILFLILKCLESVLKFTDGCFFERDCRP